MTPLAVVCLLLLAGCSDREDSAPEAGGTLVVGILSDPGTLNPLAAMSETAHTIINQMFVKLLEEKSDFLNFGPRLAERWEFGADSLSITFHLRHGVRWHDGEPVTAEDVRYTWQLQTDSVVAWGGRHFKERITDVEIVDSHTVRYHFSNRYPYQLMDANDGVILPKHLVERIPKEEMRSAEFGRVPVGDGPFKFVKWEPGQYVELARNADYFGGEPAVERVVFRIVPDMTTLITQLKTGEVDCLENVPADALGELESRNGLRFYRYLSRSVQLIFWNIDNELFADREVRRALAMAIDGREIIDTVMGGRAAPGAGPMHPMFWAHDPDLSPLPYDPDRARRMLKRLGWSDSDGDGVIDKDGRPFEFEMSTNQGNQERADILTMAQAYLGRVGIRVNAQILEFNTFLQQLFKSEFESCVFGYGFETRVDLTSYWKSTSTPPGGFNASRYSNAEVDALIERARDTLDAGEARELWYRCQHIIHEDQPAFVVAYPYTVVALRSRFCNVEPSAIGFFVNLAEWYTNENCGVGVGSNPPPLRR